MQFGNIDGIVDAKSDEEWAAPRLENEARQRAGVLAQRGVRPGDRVIILYGGTPSFFADLFAVWRIGACAICLNPGTTTFELETIIDFTEARLVLVAPDSEVASGPLAAPVLCSAEQAAQEFEEVAGAGSLERNALILFTSGTTGAPKGVVHTFRSLLARVALNQAYIGDADLARTLNVLPTHFGHGLIGNCLTPLLAGACLVLAPGVNAPAAARLGALIDNHMITFMSSVPSLWKLVLKLSEPPTQGSLRRLHVGSAPLSADLWRQIVDWAGTQQVVNMYGITETANWLAGASACERDPVDGCVGRMWGGSAAVLTETGSLRAHGDGELVVQSPSLMKGYYRRDDLTRRILKDGWFLTGDLGRIDGDGVIWLTGRKKFEINRAGIKVHPEDIDILLESHEEVREACAFAIPDDVLGEAVGVAVAPVDDVELDLGALRRWCAPRLVKEKLPDRWFVVPDMPKTDRGKIDRDVVVSRCLKQTNEDP